MRDLNNMTTEEFIEYLRQRHNYMMWIDSAMQIRWKTTRLNEYEMAS